MEGSKFIPKMESGDSDKYESMTKGELENELKKIQKELRELEEKRNRFSGTDRVYEKNREVILSEKINEIQTALQKKYKAENHLDLSDIELQ